MYSGTILNPNIIRIRIRPNICALILFYLIWEKFICFIPISSSKWLLCRTTIILRVIIINCQDLGHKLSSPQGLLTTDNFRPNNALQGLKDGLFWQKWLFSDHKKWHFWWQNQNSKTTFIVQTFPKYCRIGFYFIKISPFSLILAKFQFCWFSGLFWAFFPCKKGKK